MSISKTLQISASSLAAERLRMQTIASNMANARTTRTEEGGPYKRRMPVFEATQLDPFGTALQQQLHGVTVEELRTSDDPPVRVYDPGHPDAAPDGYVDYPDIDVLEEMVDLMATARTFEANTKVVDATKQMAFDALAIGRG